MPARFADSRLVEAHAALRATGTRGRELAEVLDRYNTRVRFASFVVGGFTLNFINRVYLQPLRRDYTPWDFKYLVTLLAHEACHVEQRFWVDSIEQEIRAYVSQCRVAVEMGFYIGQIQEVFANLDAALAEHQETAREALLSLFAGQPAAVIYAALPLAQPTGIGAIGPGLRQLAAVVRVGIGRGSG